MYTNYSLLRANHYLEECCPISDPDAGQVVLSDVSSSYPQPSHRSFSELLGQSSSVPQVGRVWLPLLSGIAHIAGILFIHP